MGVSPHTIAAWPRFHAMPSSRPPIILGCFGGEPRTLLATLLAMFALNTMQQPAYWFHVVSRMLYSIFLYLMQADRDRGHFFPAKLLTWPR